MSPILSSTIEQAVVRLLGWCTVEKAIRLAELIETIKPELTVELGVFGGRSLIPMALAVRENRNGHVVGIDPWTLDAALEGDNAQANNDWWSKNVNLDNVYRGFAQAVVSMDLLRECWWVRAKSDQALNLFADESIDIFHQDSNHSELVSCREASQWHRKIKKGGYWILDDSDWESQKKCVAMIQEFGFNKLEDCKTYTIFHRF